MTNPEHFARLMDLFKRACEVDAVHRERFLQEATGDAGLRDEVLAMLVQHASADDGAFLASLRIATQPEPGAAVGSTLQRPVSKGPMTAAEQPRSIGPYRILGPLGEGGMGTVYKAEQTSPVRRLVALKVIRSGMDTARILRRFEAERQALALMNHDNIARVYDAGTSEHHQPYFVMEYVDGQPITAHCDQHKLTNRQRLEMFLGVCAGITHAHQKGIIHRDLKPSNILVSAHGGTTVPKIIDFGLARAMQPGVLLEGTLTQQGQVVGTPDYMAPEQARSPSTSVDVRTDVYSATLVLHELLTGLSRFPVSKTSDLPVHEILRRVQSAELIRPSLRLTGTGLARAASLRRTTPAGLRRFVAGDLDWILCKGAANDPDRRYASVADLGADIRRLLDKRPVEAGPPRLSYRARKFVARNRLAVFAGSIVTGSLLAAVVGVTIFAFAADTARAELADTVAQFNLLALPERLRDVYSQEEQIYPARPENVDRIAVWCDRAEAVVKSGALAEGALKEFEGVSLEVDDMARDSRSVLRAALEKFVVDLKPLRERVSRVRGDLDWARAVEERTIRPHLERWQKARRDLQLADGVHASSLYANRPVDLQPQVGLVPIGMNPATGLWEFYHLRSAAPDAPMPEHAADGRLTLQPGSGMVFVLIPGGEFEMGATKEVDAMALDSEAPVRRVTLDAFFLSRYEMTQGQWLRVAGSNRSQHHEGESRFVQAGMGLLHPVEQLSWLAAMTHLRRFGLTLPTEAQWEYAARAGTTTPWLVDAADELDSIANLADAYAKANGGHESWPYDRTLNDGFVCHAPVGCLAPNRFGLHDVIGNVKEWCLDEFHWYDHAPQPGNGVRAGDPMNASRMARGGSFMCTREEARSARRFATGADRAEMDIGVRAARAIDGVR